MKKFILYLFLVVYALFFFKSNVYATYNPLSVKNNQYGIHILYPDELTGAASLVNSNGGDWGYVTIPIMASDKNLVKWQAFMDQCRQYHIIPIMRIATNGDFFSPGSWQEPTDNDVLDFANFLNSLNWPTKNRYVVIFNEPNRGDEWGGTPDASQYAQILDYAAKIFKERSSDFFVISAGLDNASANVFGQSIDEYSFMTQMNQSVPGIFSEIDGIASHSYPNPAFSQPPSFSREGIYSFYYQENMVNEFSGKNPPVFITETGWSTNSVSQSQQINYYSDSFKNYWNDPNIVAVTPFIYDSEQGPFTQFSFLNNNQKTDIFTAYQNFSKTKGQPILNPLLNPKSVKSQNFPTERFKIEASVKNVFDTMNKSAKSFFKWLLIP